MAGMRACGVGRVKEVEVESGSREGACKARGAVRRQNPGCQQDLAPVGMPPGRRSPVPAAGFSHICPHCIPQGLHALLGTGPTLFRPREASGSVSGVWLEPLLIPWAHRLPCLL